MAWSGELFLGEGDKLSITLELQEEWYLPAHLARKVEVDHVTFGATRRYVALVALEPVSIRYDELVVSPVEQNYIANVSAYVEYRQELLGVYDPLFPEDVHE
jgi:hypothetical protein